MYQKKKWRRLQLQNWNLINGDTLNMSGECKIIDYINTLWNGNLKDGKKDEGQRMMKGDKSRIENCS